MSDAADEHVMQPVSSLRSKFEQLAAASAPSGPSSVRSRSPGITQRASLGVSEFGEVHRVRARSTPSSQVLESSNAATNGTHSTSPTRSSDFRGSPSSPDLGHAYRNGNVAPNGSTVSEGSTPSELYPPSRPFPVNEEVVSPGHQNPPIIPSVVVDPAPALSRKPPPPPPPLRRRKSGESVASSEGHETDEKPKYPGLQTRLPKQRSVSPVMRSTSAPTFLLSPQPVPYGSPEPEFLDGHVYSESPKPIKMPTGAPPLPARPAEVPTRLVEQPVDELGRHAAPPTPSSLRHRPTLSTGGIRELLPRPPSFHSRTIPARTKPAAKDSLIPEVPPPLPIRPRVSPTTSDDVVGSAPPRLPARRPPGVTSPPNVAASSAQDASSLRPMPRSAPPTHPLLADRSPVAVDLTNASPPPQIPPLHLPPPTRTVALGPKVQPVKKSAEEESSESEEEEEMGDAATVGAPGPSPTTGVGLKRGVDDLPDATYANRRPPTMFADRRSFSAPFFSGQYGVMASSGTFVCMGSHSVRVYNVESPEDKPVLHVNLEDTGLEWRVKEPRVTAMEFRAGSIPEEDGRFLWCGTKDGHLWELDIRTGLVTDKRSGAHTSSVVQIYRLGLTMLTIEESGKVFIFEADPQVGQNAPDMSKNPRLLRIPDKQLFVRPLGKDGQLWTSDGPGGGGGLKALQSSMRGPSIRIYDTRPSLMSSRTIITPEQVGAVTSGCLLPTHPEWIFIGHEAGSISIWSRMDDEPTCVKIVKIGPSDILAMEGVMNRLWIGNRQGTISAYEIDTWPWKVTNTWKAHGDSPVARIIVDVHGIARCNRLMAVSTGKDERIRIWDGLLATHWIGDELLKRETEFCSFRSINVLLCTWNVDAAKPEALTGTPENATFFEQCLHSVELPDIIVFSFQEIIDLESRKLTAKTVLLGGSKRADGSISEKVSRHYKLWYDRLIASVRIAMPPDQPYTPILTENLVGLFTCVFVRQSEKHLYKNAAITTVKTGMAGMYGNKGAIVARMVLDDASICFMNCHLSAGQQHVRERNSDLAAVLEDKNLFIPPEMEPAEDNLVFGGGGDGSMVLDHEICFLSGDLNYRIDQRRDAIVSNVRNGDVSVLLPYDQLQKELRNNPGFRLRGFVEAPITFKPTYKYDRRSDDYDSSTKKRAPAWCDRHLYRVREPSRVQALNYRRYETNISDHRPVSAGFRVTIKSLAHDVQMEVKRQLLVAWKIEEKKGLDMSLSFYRAQGRLLVR